MISLSTQSFNTIQYNTKRIVSGHRISKYESLYIEHPKYPFTIYHICLAVNVGWTLGYIHFLHLFNKLYNQIGTSIELYLHFQSKTSEYL